MQIPKLNKTILIVEVEHKKPLPLRQDICDIVATRTYSWLFSEGCEAGVTAKRLRVESVDHGSAPHESEGSVCDV